MAHLTEPRLAELALDVEFLREAEAAVRLHAHVGRPPARLGRQQLGHIRLGPAGLARLEHPRRLLHHVGRRFDIDP